MSVAARLAVTFLTVFGAEQVLPAVAPGVSASAMPVDYTVFVPRAKDDPSRKDPTQVGDLVNEHFTVVDNPKTGSLLAFWTQETRESAPDMHVAFARSTDGGANWTKPCVLWGASTLKSNVPNAKWQIPMVSKSGRVYCFWNQNEKPGAGMGRGLMMGAKSDDDGATWSVPVRLEGPKGFWCVWQRPMRFAPGERFLTAISISDEKLTKTCFLRFENIDDDPDVKDVRFTILNRDKVLEGEEASIVKLPDGRLFAVMRSRLGHPLWTESRDGGETWSASKPVKDASGKTVAHPRAPCPMYDLGGDAAGSGDVFALFCDRVNPKASQWEGRGPLHFYRGAFDPQGEQPVRFTKGDVLLTRDGSSHYGNSCYSSFTRVGGQGVLWYPDEKFALYGARLPREEGAALFNGSDLSGWTGATHMYVADASEPGVLRCEQARIDEWKTCNLFTEREYGDFVLSFECNMAKGANNGVGIRMPEKIKGEPAWESFCEVQLIDDDSSPRLKPHQHTGSVYGVIPATPGADGRYAKPCGEWSRYEIRVVGTTIEVRIDGRLATKGDLAQWKGDGDTVDGKPHPGLHRTRGRIGFLGHYTDRPAKDMIVRWRNIRIKEL